MSLRSTVVTLVACMMSIFVAHAAFAQVGKHGAYSGKIAVTHSEKTRLENMTLQGEVKLSFPVTSRSATAMEADLLDGASAKATMLVTQYDTFQTASGPDSGGQINTTTCKLAQPIEVPLMVQGMFSVNLSKKMYTFSLALLSQKEVPMNCVHSRSGAMKRNKGFTLGVGTHEPGPPPDKGVAFKDVGLLAASFTMPQGPAMKGQGVLPVVQAWEFKLQP